MMEHMDNNGGVVEHAANSREAAGGNKHANQIIDSHHNHAKGTSAAASGDLSPSETAAGDHAEKVQ